MAVAVEGGVSEAQCGRPWVAEVEGIEDGRLIARAHREPGSAHRAVIDRVRAVVKKLDPDEPLDRGAVAVQQSAFPGGLGECP